MLLLRELRGRKGWAAGTLFKVEKCRRKNARRQKA
jgi:hypothetical protein